MRLHHLAILLGVVAVARAQGNANGGANAGNGVNAGNGANADPNDEDGVAGASTYTTTLPVSEDHITVTFFQCRVHALTQHPFFATLFMQWAVSFIPFSIILGILVSDVFGIDRMGADRHRVERKHRNHRGYFRWRGRCGDPDCVSFDRWHPIVCVIDLILLTWYSDQPSTALSVRFRLQTPKQPQPRMQQQQ